MPNLTLPSLELSSFIQIMPHSLPHPGRASFQDDVTVHCQRHADDRVMEIARHALQDRVAYQLGRCLADEAQKRPNDLEYVFDARRVLVSGSVHALARVRKYMSTGNELQSAHLLGGTAVHNLVLECPLAYSLQDSDGDEKDLRWWMARIHLNETMVTVTHQANERNYLANFSISYQIELAPGHIYSEYASSALASFA